MQLSARRSRCEVRHRLQQLSRIVLLRIGQQLADRRTFDDLALLHDDDPVADAGGNAQAVEANVPLANMFGYVNELRSFTQGRAQYSMQFSHYDEVPANVAQEVKEKLA